MKKYKISDIITIVLCLGIIVGFFAAFIIIPDKSRSDFENKKLQEFPAPVGETAGDFVIHGDMAAQFDEYFCDQFPMREQFMSFKALIELTMGRNDNGGVLYADGRLATIRFDAMNTDGETTTNTEFFYADFVQASLDKMQTLCNNSKTDIKIMLPPRNIDVVGEPMGYDGTVGTTLDNMAKETLGDSYVTVLDALKGKHNNGEEVYFKTDHHWTVLGAYYAYCAVMESFGEKAFALEEFDFQTVAEDFKGTALTNGNYFFLAGEELKLARYDGDEEFTVKSYGNDKKTPVWQSNSFYDMKKLDTYDKYGTFLSGKPKYMTVVKEGAGRETLLLMKDSFGHSLAPFLARHYDLIIVDMDEASTNLTESLSFGELTADKALVVYNMQNVVASDKVQRLR